jgi:hypothetical protein
MDDQYEPKPPANTEPSLEMIAIMERMRKALQENPEDVDQKELVKVIQENRAHILQYAMGQYLQNPKSASLLEGVTSLIGQMEGAVRNDRKERAKKQDQENNVISFNQMLDAMKGISNGQIIIPHFDMADFILDPGQSLLTRIDVDPIKPEELVQGNELIDIDGNAV